MFAREYVPSQLCDDILHGIFGEAGRFGDEGAKAGPEEHLANVHGLSSLEGVYKELQGP